MKPSSHSPCMVKPKPKYMLQLLDNLRTGEISITETPCPAVSRNNVLIRSQMTLISAGTERMLLEFGKANLVEKARQQPDKVRMVLDKIRTDGMFATLETIQAKL